MREPAKTFEDLVVWQKAHQFVLAVYRVSRSFPRSETYGLTSQFRRAAVSVAANIAEGFRKRGKADKIRFLNIAQGSLEESRYYPRRADARNPIGVGIGIAIGVARAIDTDSDSDPDPEKAGYASASLIPYADRCPTTTQRGDAWTVFYNGLGHRSRAYSRDSTASCSRDASGR
jgi:four helix bundle protein